MAMPVAAEALAMQRLYHWERTAPERVALTQPVGGGNVKEFTWRDVMDQTRRMAAHLQGLGYDISFERVRAIAGDDLIARPHVAQAMVEAGIVGTDIVAGGGFGFGTSTKVLYSSNSASM